MITVMKLTGMMLIQAAKFLQLGTIVLVAVAAKRKHA